MARRSLFSCIVSSLNAFVGKRASSSGRTGAATMVALLGSIGCSFGDNGAPRIDYAFDIEALRLAIEDMRDAFGDAYPRGGEYLARLDAFAADMETLRHGLEQKDPGARARFEELMQLRREALLANPLLDFNQILVVRRHAHLPGLPHNWQGNCSLPRGRYDNEIALLSMDAARQGSTAALNTLYRPLEDVFVGDISLHWDGDRLLFSSHDKDWRWHVYELAIAGGAPRRLTPDEDPDVDYYDACYLPDGRIITGSTAAYVAVPCVYGSDNVSNLYLLDPSSGAMRQLCFDQDHNWSPRVLPNGRVLYHRWEYSDTPHSNTRMLFHMNPDGTDQRAYWGSGAYFPNSFFYARPVPGLSGKIVGIASGHHGTQRSGRLLIVEPARGKSEPDGIVQEIPGRGKTVNPMVRDRLVDDVWPQFLHPYPLSEKYFLVSMRPAPDALWGIYLADVFDNMTLIAEIADYALFEPIPLRAEAKPPIVPDRVDLAQNTGVVYVQNIYEGGGLDGIRKGRVKELRVFSYYFGRRGQGGLLGTLGIDSAWDIKRVLGTVPVEADGSAHFIAPANTALAVQPLDEQGQALQIMRSWFTLQPGERASCVGCHESQRSAPPSEPAIAFLRPPSTLSSGWHQPERGFAFHREVQPVLDRYCGGCHGDAPPEGMAAPYGREFPYLRGDRMIDDWSTQISGGVGPDRGGVFSRAYADLQRFVRRPGIESDMRMLAPGDYHFSATELGQLLRKGHYNTALDRESWERLATWVDLNAPYHGTWAETHPCQQEHAPKVNARADELRRRFAPAGPHVDLEHIPELPAYDNTFVGPAPSPGETQEALKIPGWPFGAAEAAEYHAAAAAMASDQRETSFSIDLGEGVQLDMTLIPGGRFVMGSNEGHPDERPTTAVALRPFWMGRVEVTNAQYKRFNPQHESRDESRHGYQFGRKGFSLDGPQQPVVRVSWEEALQFCAWLSERTGMRITLPSEAQWEWAARAGSDQDFFFGAVDSDFSRHANLADRKLQEFAQCTARENYERAEVIQNPNRYDDRIPRCDRFDDGAMVSTDVGNYLPNAWGLHDMHGNVWEWTRSAYLPYPYREDDGRNDVGDLEAERVVRGGSWRDRPYRATASYRLPFNSDQRVFNVGFRVVALLDVQ